MGCGCKDKAKGAARSGARSSTKIEYEVFGGDLTEPTSKSTLSEARALATEHGARVRSTVVRAPAEPVPAEV